jgi:hypothetical protein
MTIRSSALLVTLALAGSTLAPLASADEPARAADPLEAQRERFRAGLEKYRAGAYAEAILVWETIYDELGPEKGYRLAFNLGRAYEQFGNPTRAAESYEAYLAEVARRREASEPLEPVVEKQEGEAKERLAELGATQGRIRIAGDRSVIVKIDGGAERIAPTTGLVVYVTPDREHTITFNPGTRDEMVVRRPVEAGKQIELAPPEPASAPLPPPARTAPPAPPIRFVTREERPFDASVLYVAAGVTVASVVVPIVLYANAQSAKSDYDASRRQASTNDVEAWRAAERSGQRQSSDYYAARSTAYASYALPAVLAAASVGLAAFWFLGTTQTRVPVSAAILPGGGAAAASARF